MDKVDNAELDEMWSYVGNKKNQRWLWFAVDKATRKIIAFVFGRRKDGTLKRLLHLLKPFKVFRHYTDNWASYASNINSKHHVIGKRNTQIIERKNLTLRTRVKRLTRKTICFSKCEIMHDILVALAINVIEFGACVQSLLR